MQFARLNHVSAARACLHKREFLDRSRLDRRTYSKYSPIEPKIPIRRGLSPLYVYVRDGRVT